MDKILLTRRNMIKMTGWLLVLPFIGLSGSLINRENERAKKASLKIALNEIPEGLSFYEDFYIRRSANEFAVLSLKCTHLGCIVRQAGDGDLICPCHGSLYRSEDGGLLKGPASGGLSRMDFTREADHLTIFNAKR